MKQQGIFLKGKLNTYSLIISKAQMKEIKSDNQMHKNDPAFT